MKTYNDLMECKTEDERIRFIEAAISEHRSSELYRTAEDAALYAAQRNVTINKTVRLITSLSGQKKQDSFAVNHKCASGFFGRFVTQQVQYLLGNGVTFGDEKTKEKLGKDFDTQLQKLAEAALVGACAFGFLDNGRVEVFKITEFVPLWDEDTGALRAGIRFWQIAPDKPLKVKLYEEDGFTAYTKPNGKEIQITQEKRAYINIVASTKADGEWLLEGKNYPSFPIIPLWGNKYKQSELAGIRDKIDCYDLIMSGFANDIEEASYFYWTLENCGGMTDKDLADFIYKMRTVHAANVENENGEGGAKATAHTMDVPYNAREAALDRLKKDLYEDYMALDVSQIAAGNVTATQIEAAYEPLNEKADAWEYNVIEFTEGLLALLGIEDTPSFTRSKISNQQEYTEMVLSAASYLDDETIIRKLPFLTPEESEVVIEARRAEETERFDDIPDDDENTDDEPPTEEEETEV